MPPVEGETIEQLKAIHAKAAEEYAKLDCYIARLRRREQVNGKDNPEELMLFKFRKQPWSVYFKWVGVQFNQREVVYVKNQYGNNIHTLLSPKEMGLFPMKRMALPPDNLFVRSASRHRITESGFGYAIEKFGQLVGAAEKGEKNQNTLKYLGRQQRPEFTEPLEVVEQGISPGVENDLPRGGTRWWMFHTGNRLPVLMITTDHLGHEVEYYCYDDIMTNVKLDDDDFNPDKLWGR